MSLVEWRGLSKYVQLQWNQQNPSLDCSGDTEDTSEKAFIYTIFDAAQKWVGCIYSCFKNIYIYLIMK